MEICFLLIIYHLCLFLMTFIFVLIFLTWCDDEMLGKKPCNREVPEARLVWCACEFYTFAKIYLSDYHKSICHTIFSPKITICLCNVDHKSFWFILLIYYIFDLPKTSWYECWAFHKNNKITMFHELNRTSLSNLSLSQQSYLQVSLNYHIVDPLNIHRW